MYCFWDRDNYISQNVWSQKVNPNVQKCASFNEQQAWLYSVVILPSKPVSLEYTHGVIPNFTPVKCCKNLEMPWGALGLCLLTYLPVLLLPQFYIQLPNITNALEFEF